MPRARTRPPRFRRRRWPWIAGATALAVLVVADRAGLLLVRRPDDMTQYDGVTAQVTAVLDGQAFEIDLRDPVTGRAVTLVKLWGVTCPDSGLAAAEARALTRRAALRRRVVLRLESHRTRGAMGRVLAHVELPDGSSLNERLLAAGLARADDRLPHSLLGRYAQLERAAQRQGLGLWR